MPRRRFQLLALCLALASLGPAHPGRSSQAPSREVRWLQGYLRLDTTNPPGREHLAAAYLGGLLREHGAPYELLVTPAGRTSLYARLQATPGRNAPALVLLHHMDVVAPGPDWVHDPFGGQIDGDAVWGRGAIDAKGLGIAQLAAFLAAAQTPDRERDLILLAVADEEQGGAHGTHHVLDQHPDLFTDVAGVINEGGSIRYVNGRLHWFGIETTQKRPLWLELRARGRPGHAASYNPRSSTHQLLEGLGRLVELDLGWRVSQPARDYLKAIAALHNDHWREVFENIDDHIAPEGPTTGLIPGMSALFLDTLQITVLEAASQINVVPAEARARVDLRLLPDTDAERVLTEIRGALGPGIEVEILLLEPQIPPSPQAGPVYESLSAALAPEALVVPFFSSGFTDSRYFRQRGIPAYGFYPFALEPTDLIGIHGAEEHMPLGAFDTGVERLGRVVQAWIEGR